MTTDEQNRWISNQIKNDDNFPQELPIKETIGKSQLMFPRTYAKGHVATPLLEDYATHGCPANCGPNWTRHKILLLLKKGPHQSSKQRDAIKQLRKETTEKISNGYARIVKWGSIKNNIPPQLKISPVAMIPHKSKKYRCILDLSFTLFHKGIAYKSVNDTTAKCAPQQSMSQLGLCLKRIIALMADNYNLNKPFMFSKLDIKDGFWRMRVSNDQAWNFCYVLPTTKHITNDDDIEIVVPNSLQMGWCESPPLFCTGTETARDIIHNISHNQQLPQHRFEHIMLKNIKNTTNTTQDPNHVTLQEVFVDDFVGITNNTTHQHLQQLSRSMINGIHSIFPPPEITNHPGGDPISEKKLLSGDGTWTHDKEILGWIFDGKKFTITLSAAKCDTIILQIRKLLQLKRPSLNKYQKIAGKLQHASFGLPAGVALFSPIQMAMKNNPSFIDLTDDLRQTFLDWKFIIQHMKRTPTSVLQLMQNYPDYLGHSDSCGLGTGGTWSSGLKPIKPFLWQLEWPNDIKTRLVSSTNPKGDLTINDLELAGLVLNWLALECQKGLHLAYHHIGTFCDNTSAVSWANKLRTSKSLVAGRLLRLLGLRIHSRQASSLIPLHIAGENNIMADIVSRAFKHGKFFLAKTNLTSYFNTHFPLAQGTSWTEFILPKEIVSPVISCLRGELSPMASLLRLPRIGPNTGTTGSNILRYSESIPSCLIQFHPSKETASSSHLLQGLGQAYTVEELKSKFRPSRMRCRPSARPSSWLATAAPFTDQIKNTTSQ
jgi:hypothetical protein